MIYSIDVVTADTSKLENRGLAFAFTSSPYMIIAFAGSKASEGFYNSSWRWGFGAFSIIIPFVALGMGSILIISKQKAKKKGLLINESSGRTLTQSIWFYAVEFDSMCTHGNQAHDLN